jgi:hypothetical protein
VNPMQLYVTNRTLANERNPGARYNHTLKAYYAQPIVRNPAKVRIRL